MVSEDQFQRPVKIADGIFWVGHHDPGNNLHCNPFLVVEGERAILIDSGSRPDFTNIMMKILQTGIHPRQIEGLIYQHFDPDLCGSIPNFLELCQNPGLKVYSKASNNIFIRHYIEHSKHHLIQDIEEIGDIFQLGDRKLTFLKTPFAHSTGSFVTFDEKTGTLFTSDLFGSLSKKWSLFLDLSDSCFTCKNFEDCPNHRDYCPLPDLLNFHRHVMPCGKALQFAMKKIRPLPIKRIAPQHGSVIDKPQDIRFLIETLASLTDVGIDGVADED